MIANLTINTTEGNKNYSINIPENPLFKGWCDFLHSLAELTEDETLNHVTKKVEALECLGVDVSSIETLPNDLELVLDGLIDVSIKYIESIEPYEIKPKQKFKVGRFKYRLYEVAKKLGFVSISARRTIEALHVNEMYAIKESDKHSLKVYKNYKSSIATFAYLTTKGNHLPNSPEELTAFINNKIKLLDKSLRYKDVKSLGFFLNSMLARYDKRKNINLSLRASNVQDLVNQMINKGTMKRKCNLL